MSETGRRLVELEAEVAALKGPGLHRLADAAEGIRDELRRANDARDDLYREVVSALAYLRQDASKGPGERA